MNDLVSHFDREANEYPIQIGSDYTQNRKWALVLEHAPRVGVAADIGAATGRHAIKLASSKRTVVAVDPSIGMLDELLRHAEACRAKETIHRCAAALPNLPFAKNSFDLAFCFSTLLLLTPGAQAEAVATMAGTLRPGGTLIVDLAGTRSLAIRYWRRYYRSQGLDGVYGHTAADACRLLERNGLEIISQEAHGTLSQFLLFPGLQAIPGLVRLIRGGKTGPGWDAAVSRRVPRFAERWYIVARKPVHTDS
ncbi:MAG: hypothetical protein CL573_06490 [Alphaproteobacteria bacterium]|nr:hypothetical protein [Alphaproteobacteria bacterium]